MSIAEIEKSTISGTISLPSSKSVAHRALICSFLAGGGRVSGITPSKDIEATISAIEALKRGDEVIDCNESGSTLRFFIPIAAALGKSVTFTGKGKLPQRPIGDYLRLLPGHGVECKSGGGLPLCINGRLCAGTFELAGNVSSQYITGLLMALPLLEESSKIVLTTPLESKPYVDLTIDVLSSFGIEIEQEDNAYIVKGNQKYKITDYTVESDWSQSAFFLAAGALGGNVKIKGLRQSSAQGDKEIVNILRRFGADITDSNGVIEARKSLLHGCEIDVSDIPDTVPAIAVCAAFASGKTVIKGGERLRLKESDRIESVVSNLKKMKIEAYETPDGMIICGGKPIGAALNGFNDHRIVMAFTVAGLYSDSKTIISGAESINKSYPAYFDDLKGLGGKINVICNR